jgi:hypothetical protein
MTTKMGFRLAAASLMLYTGCAESTTVADDAPKFAQQPGLGHAVTGSGEVAPFPGFAFRQTFAVHSDADGRLHGSVTAIPLDMSAYGLPSGGILVQEIRCLIVSGNTAWIGTRITRSSNPAAGAVGEIGVAWVVDQGGPGQDIMYGGPSWFWDPDDGICSGTLPSLPPTLASGNLHVR